MHWLTLLILAFAYAIVGSLVGSAYALLTGAETMRSFSSVMTFGVLFGPVVAVAIAVFRKLAQESTIPIARAIYHTLLVTVAAPVLMYGAQLLAGAFDVPNVARSFEVMKYWMMPLVFIAAVFYGIWRLVEHEARRQERRASGSTGGPSSAPPSGSGNPGGQPTTAQRADASGSSSEPPNTSRVVTAAVACFSSRGTPFRLIHPSR